LAKAEIRRLLLLLSVPRFRSSFPHRVSRSLVLVLLTILGGQIVQMHRGRVGIVGSTENDHGFFQEIHGQRVLDGFFALANNYVVFADKICLLFLVMFQNVLGQVAFQTTGFSAEFTDVGFQGCVHLENKNVQT